MSEKEKINKDLLLKCVEIAAGGQELGRYNSYVFASALDIYRFLQDQQLRIDVSFTLPDGRIAHTCSRGMTIPEIIEDYRSLKSKELSDEAVKSQGAANNGKPLNPNVKPAKTFFSRLFPKFRSKK